MVKPWWKGRRSIITVLIIALGAAGFAGFKHYKKDKQAPEEESEDLVESAKGDIELKFMDSGELAPKVRVDIASQVSGRIIELPVTEGQRVKKGDKLAVVQPGRSALEKYLPVEITSPIGGIVMRYQEEGGYKKESTISRLTDYVTGLIQSNSPTYLMTVADLSQLIVKMKISEMDILKVSEGMKVNVKVDAIPDKTFPAKVTLVSPQADKDSNNLKSFKVEVSLMENDRRLKPGMTARVDGLLESRKDAVKIPLSAIFEEKGLQVAYRKEGEGSERVELTLGLRNETEAEVKEGASEGQKFFTEKPKEEKKSKWFGKKAKKSGDKKKTAKKSEKKKK